MLSVGLVKIFDMDFDSFVREHIYFIFFDNALCRRQGNGKDSQYFVDSPVGFSHASKKIMKNQI